ncbi:hypothetical protein M413DRAFT_438885 [Hebeloma cylindrosporum]|uniref:Uncharacterized protein n=1 Tax=Hebeloma cylindrosporum TaxID=76867 RepID=A0A0C3D0W9_HEBCY|nr:hypothetical protein M413DRAFT_438885 [Hebeloma cylindrosporum h7]
MYLMCRYDISEKPTTTTTPVSLWNTPAHFAVQLEHNVPHDKRLSFGKDSLAINPEEKHFGRIRPVVQAC